MKLISRGFTLIELLVALSLLSVLMVLIAGAFGLGNRALDLSEHFSYRLNEVRSAQNFLRSSLQQSLSVPFLHDEKNNQWVFEGERDSMRFVASVAPHLAGGIQLHSLFSKENGQSTSDLQVTFTKIEDLELHPWGSPQTLLQNLRELRLSYRGLDNSQHATDWLDRWPWPDRLPQYVRIELTPMGQIDWPILVVAIRTSSSESVSGTAP